MFDQIQAAERAGNLSPEDKKKLEEQAAEKGLQALFKGAKLEIESVLRETCERVLEDPSIGREKANLRAVAMQMLGEVFILVDFSLIVFAHPHFNQAYANVSKDGQAIGDDSEYVRIETRRNRDSTGGNRRNPASPK